MSTFLNNHCDGSGPHFGPLQVRVRPGNLILCRACWNKENRYCQERAKETGEPEDWPIQDWDTAEVYASYWP